MQALTSENDRWNIAAGFAPMEYKGIRYEVVQTANPTGFKWIVHLDETRIRTGESFSMKAAIVSAQWTIDKALKAFPKKK